MTPPFAAAYAGPVLPRVSPSSAGRDGPDREAARRGRPGGGPRLGGRLQVERGDGGARGRERQRDRLPDATAGARHEGDLACEVGRSARIRRHAAENTTSAGDTT